MTRPAFALSAPRGLLVVALSLSLAIGQHPAGFVQGGGTVASLARTLFAAVAVGPASAAQCIDYGAFDAHLRGVEDIDCAADPTAVRDRLAEALSSAVLGPSDDAENTGCRYAPADAAGRLLTPPPGADAPRDQLRFFPAFGHYVVFRNYDADLFFRVVPSRGGDRSASGETAATVTTARERLRELLRPERLSCAFGASPAAYADIRIFTFSYPFANAPVGLTDGFADGSDPEGSDGAEKPGEGDVQAMEDARNAAKGAAKESGARAEPASSSGSSGGSDGGGSETASPGLIPGGQAWIGDIMRMVLAYFGLDQTTMTALLALQMLAPELLAEMGKLANEMTEGLESEDLDKLMSSARQAFTLAMSVSSMMEGLAGNVDGVENLADALNATAKSLQEMPPELRARLAGCGNRSFAEHVMLGGDR